MTDAATLAILFLSPSSTRGVRERTKRNTRMRRWMHMTQSARYRCTYSPQHDAEALVGQLSGANSSAPRMGHIERSSESNLASEQTRHTDSRFKERSVGASMGSEVGVLSAGSSTDRVRADAADCRNRSKDISMSCLQLD